MENKGNCSVSGKLLSRISAHKCHITACVFDGNICRETEQDRHCTYNVTLRLAGVTIVAVERQICIAYSECVYV